MKKKIAFLAIGIAFALGFLTGSIVSILKRAKGIESSMTDLMTQRSVAKGTISIELMEKIEDLKETVREDPKDLAAWLKLGDIYKTCQKTPGF